MSWIRARFKTDENDYRPVKWPPPGPFWCTGYGDGSSIVVAYMKNEKQIEEYWPDAEEVEITQRDEITFTDRFPKPEWTWCDETP